MKSIEKKLIIVCCIVLMSQFALATPTFQAYIDGGYAGTYGGDEQSWFTSDSSFDLIVVGAYGAHTQSLKEVTLILSVPKGETGTISITGSSATLLTSRTAVTGTGYYNPNSDADLAILSDVAGMTGYSDKSFLPEGTNFGNHYPYQEGVSDFLIYGIGDFSDLGSIHNYNADGGIITVEGSGQEKVFSVEVGGFSAVHFDTYGYEETDNGQVLRATWDINPGSHDSTYVNYVPVPSSLLLSAIGLSGVCWLKRKFSL